MENPLIGKGFNRSALIELYLKVILHLSFKMSWTSYASMDASGYIKKN